MGRVNIVEDDMHFLHHKNIFEMLSNVSAEKD